MFRLRFFLALLLPCLSQAQDWKGCVDRLNPQALVTIGQKTTICLVLTNAADWTKTVTSYTRLSFQPVADEYSRFHVPNSFYEMFLTDSAEYTGGAMVHVASQKNITFQKQFYDGDKKVFPYLTAIILVENGVVQGITWDDASVFCAKNEAEDNTYHFNGTLAKKNEVGGPVKGCIRDFDECSGLQSGENRAECDLTLYVVWTGTDAQGNSLSSAAYRFSQFPVQGLSDRLSQFVPDTDFNIDLNPLN